MESLCDVYFNYRVGMAGPTVWSEKRRYIEIVGFSTHKLRLKVPHESRGTLRL